MANRLKLLELDEVSFVDQGAGEGVKLMIVKRKDNNMFGLKKKIIKEGEAAMSIEEAISMAPEEAQQVILAYIAAMKPSEEPAPVEAAAKEEGEDKPKEEEEKPEDEAAKAATKRLQKMQETIDHLERVTKRQAVSVEIEKSGAICPGMTRDEMIESYLDVEKAMGKARADKLLQSWKSIGGLTESSAIFKALGSTSEADQTDVQAKVEAKVAEIQKRQTGITKGQALHEVFKNEPALYEAYKTGKGA